MNLARILIISHKTAKLTTPHASVLERLKERDIRIWRTDREGGAHIELLRYDRSDYPSAHVKVEPLNR